MLLEILQHSLENTCARDSFLIKKIIKLCNFIKKETLTQVFSCEFCEISKNTFLHRTPLVAASVSSFLLHTKIQMQPLELPCKKDVLRNFAKFTGKHLCQRLFFNKVAGLRSATLLKKRLWHRRFPVIFSKEHLFYRTDIVIPVLTR